MTAFVVFNPNSAGGRTDATGGIEEALEKVFPDVPFVTTGPAQAAHMVRDALRDGHLEIVAVGGDGTINEALNGFFESGAPVAPDAVFSSCIAAMTAPCAAGSTSRRAGGPA